MPASLAAPDSGGKRYQFTPSTYEAGVQEAPQASLTEEQQGVLEAVRQGRSVFITGKAGTGACLGTRSSPPGRAVLWSAC